VHSPVAKYKYKQDKEVNFITINPENFEDPLKNIDTYDVIICSEVLEHVDDPLFMVKYLLDKLPLNGLFVFDFISSSGTGLDTPNGLIFRKAALQYISERVEVLNGEISIEKSCGLCIVRKVLN
jgi:2-polyprenyl-3-methyl-5-hydroxy-6-metoxy-1,4-benzoquinol methylase